MSRPKHPAILPHDLSHEAIRRYLARPDQCPGPLRTLNAQPAEPPIWRSAGSMLLAAQAELFDKTLVARVILLFQVIQKGTALRHERQQATT